VGDAFGYAVEFTKRDDIFLKHGPHGLLAPVPDINGKYVVSDDTQMTMFTMEALTDNIADSETIERIRQAYMDWLTTQTSVPSEIHEPVGTLSIEQEMNVQRHPGGTCLRSLMEGGRGTLEEPRNNSKGCGAVMRTAPIAFSRALSHKAVVRRAIDAGVLTHGHPSGYLSAGALASILKSIYDHGYSLEAAVEAAIEHISAYEGHEEVVWYMGRAMSVYALETNIDGKPIEGWTGEEALAMALFSVRTGDTFRDVMRIAANHDGDSDSTASIAGQIYGTIHGVTVIPNDWILNLDVYDVMAEELRDFEYAVRV